MKTSDNRLVLREAHHHYSESDDTSLLTDICVLGAVGALFAYGALFLSSPPPTWRAIGFVFLAFGTIAVPWRVRAESAARRKALSAWDADSDQCASPCLVCYGTQKELDAISNIPDTPFEPRIFVSNGRPLRARGATVVLYFTMGGAMVILGKLGFFLGLVVYVAILGSQWSRARYLRLTPQCMDVLEAWAWQSQTRLKRRIPLTTARVVCRYDRRIAVVSPRDTPDEPHWIHLGLVREPHALMEAIFRGAMAPRPAPRMPEDQLLG